MKPLLPAQEIARRNNEAAATHRAYLELRKRRKRFSASALLPESTLDFLDRAEAARISRPVRAVGCFIGETR